MLALGAASPSCLWLWSTLSQPRETRPKLTQLPALQRSSKSKKNTFRTSMKVMVSRQSVGHNKSRNVQCKTSRNGWANPRLDKSLDPILVGNSPCFSGKHLDLFCSNHLWLPLNSPLLTRNISLPLLANPSIFCRLNPDCHGQMPISVCNPVLAG